MVTVIGECISAETASVAELASAELATVESIVNMMPE